MLIHRQGRGNALLHRCDPGRLPPATSVRAKDLQSLTETKPERPLLLVDIDGVISLFSSEGAPAGEGSFHAIDGIPHFLSATAAGHLLGLEAHFELAWASGWEEKANEYLPHLLGLPKLEHLSFDGRVGRTNAHWKLDAIETYAGDRPMAWIDDAFNEACHKWAATRAAPTLLVRTLPAYGLTEREAAILERWALELERAALTGEPTLRRDSTQGLEQAPD